MPPLDSGEAPLSIDAAAGLLGKREETAKAVPETATATETVANEQEQVHVDDNSQDQTAKDTAEEPDEANLEGDEADQKPAEKPAIDPPHFWSADAKAQFANLPPELQQVVVEQAKNGEGAVTKAQQAAADARKKADTEFGNVSQVAQALQQWLPQAVQTFNSRYENIDWKAWYNQDFESATKARLEYDDEKAQLEQVKAANQQAQEIERQRFYEAEAEQLKLVAPALADPKDGPKRRAELAEYLTAQGVPQDQLPNVTAVAASLAYKAMMYDKAQAGLKSPPLKQPAPVTVRPTAAQSGTPVQRQVATAKGRFDKTPSIANAVDFLTAKGSA